MKHNTNPILCLTTLDWWPYNLELWRTGFFSFARPWHWVWNIWMYLMEKTYWLSIVWDYLKKMILEPMMLKLEDTTRQEEKESNQNGFFFLKNRSAKNFYSFSWKWFLEQTWLIQRWKFYMYCISTNMVAVKIVCEVHHKVRYMESANKEIPPMNYTICLCLNITL